MGQTRRTGPRAEGRSRVEAAATTTAIMTRTGDRWSDTYQAARRWVAWTARRRWPHHPANDQIWAASVASWWHGPGVRRG